ncbi:hypothetical protein BY996DRAFT_1240191 [Phakopsora pachyrhizi]|nr:hypothetical protein BY996DRAFT_1240191 [Phakopsora pachyrhizi]
MHTLPTSSTSSRPPLSAYQYHHPLNHASRSTNLSPLAASISTTSSSSHHSSCMGVLPRPSNSDPNSALSPNSLTLQPILDCILPLAPKKCSMPDSASSCDPVFGSETLLAYNQRIPHYNNDSSNAATITQSNPGFSRSEICNSQYLDLTLDDKQIKNQGASQSFQNFTPLHPEAFQSRDVKRRTSKACDHCRKSKCKCTRAPGPDGVIRLDGPCQNCVTNGIECTFNLTSRKRIY